MKKPKIMPVHIVIAIVQLSILLLSVFYVQGWDIFLAGIVAIIMQLFLQMRYAGWVSVVAYPLTYWISGLLDHPSNGNLWVFWFFSYITITIIAIMLDIFTTYRQKNKF